MSRSLHLVARVGDRGLLFDAERVDSVVEVHSTVPAPGAAPAVVGLVVPTGYSFNLDGTNIYITLAILFLAQATNTDLSLMQMGTILLVAMLTSKGASGVTGAGFVTLAATLSVVPAIPMVALATIVGIDRFMSECRAITNIIGNGVATLAVARWEKVLDMDRLKSELRKGPSAAEQKLS